MLFVPVLAILAVLAGPALAAPTIVHLNTPASLVGSIAPSAPVQSCPFSCAGIDKLGNPRSAQSTGLYTGSFACIYPPQAYRDPYAAGSRPEFSFGATRGVRDARGVRARSAQAAAAQASHEPLTCNYDAHGAVVSDASGHCPAAVTTCAALD